MHKPFFKQEPKQNINRKPLNLQQPSQQMGTQCSNLINHISHQTPTRNSFLNILSNPITQQNHNNNNESSHDFNLGLKLQFIRRIQKQYVKECAEDILSFQKHPENRFIVKFKDGSHYRGYINEEGKRQKEGQQTWEDGTKYLGSWKSNMPHGSGILISPQGYTFEGNWNNGVVEGLGKYFGKIGSYQGQWSQNQPHGQGIQTWQDGSRYEGTYFQGKKHGKGKYTWPDKSTYNGDWANGQITGQGTYRYIDGRVYVGSFSNNKMHGKGTYSWPDGRKYVGQYEDDKKSGKGKYFWPDGRYYEGEWGDGKRNGYGKVVYPNKVVKYGMWQDDQRVEGAGEVVKDIRVNERQINDENDENDNFQLHQSPTFMGKSLLTASDSNPQTHHLILPRTEPRPLYASSFSPYKHLKTYYQQYTAQRSHMNERVANRYKFIESPLRKFNEMQLNGGGSYLQMMMEKRKMSVEREKRASMGRGKANQVRHRRRDSAFL